VRWVLATQRVNGSWGRWQGTAEETAYAVQVLLGAAPRSDRTARAAARGLAYLSSVDGVAADPPLWHDKDLYTPTAIVRAAVLAAVRLGRGVGAPLTSVATHPAGEG
jgi:halimadienyl-diphosphate synthase